MGRWKQFGAVISGVRLYVHASNPIPFIIFVVVDVEDVPSCDLSIVDWFTSCEFIDIVSTAE
jgi:hypothetical protein